MTNSLNLRKLIVNNFRTFGGKHEVDFKDSGLVLIKGINGSGKSNLLLAISYLLNFCRLSAKALQRWNTEAMSVEGHFDSPQGPIIIHRGTKATWISKNGTKVKGSVKAVEEEIDQLFGCGASVRELLTYRDQVKPYAFLSMSDPQIKEVLTKILGMEPLEAEVVTRTESLKQLATDEATKVNWATLRQNELDSLPAITPFAPVSTAAQEAELNQAKLSYAEVQCQIVDVKEQIAAVPEPDDSELTRLKGKLVECQKFMKGIQDKFAAEQSTFNGAVQEKRRAIEELIRQKNKSATITADIQKLQAKLEKLGKDICPTCEQEWTQAAEHEGKLRTQLVVLKAALEQAEAAGVQAAALTVEANEFNSNAPVMDPSFPKLEAIKDKLHADIASNTSQMKLVKAEAVASLQEDLVRYMATAQGIATTISNCKAVIAQIQSDNKRGEDLFKSMTQARETAQAKATEASAQAVEASKLFRIESDYLEVIRGFRSKVFDEVLDAISGEANNILGDLPNAQAVTVEFKSEKESETGKVKYQIKPVVYIDGEARIPGEVLSGGQMASLNLAVDLAVVRVVSMRQGTSPGWIILDEYFHGHDVQTKQSCLDILAEYGRTKLVLVVEHASEFRDLFDKSISVTNVNGESQLS